MASGFSRPSLVELVSRIATDLISRLGDQEFELRRSLPGVLARIWSGAINGLYAFIEFLSRELLPDTAKVWLVRHASIYGLGRLAATFAAGNIKFTGTDGTVVPAGTLLRRSDALEYATLAEVTVAAGIAIVAIRCTTAGLAGNMDAGKLLPLVSPVAGLASNGTVEGGGLTGGAEAESDDALRARLLARIRQPPHGGAHHDYETWAREASPAVTRVWVYPKELGLGTVTIRFMMDDAYPDGIPLAADVDMVEAWLNRKDKRPVCADVYLAAPNAVPMDVTFTHLEPDTAAVRAAIEAELRDLIRREAEPKGALAGSPTGKLLISRIREAVSLAAGENDYTMTVPAADVTVATGEIITLGDITWPA